MSADLYVDCSGFASVLLGKALAEPFISFKPSLFNDRAVVGGWQRDRRADQALHHRRDDERRLVLADRARDAHQPRLRLFRRLHQRRGGRRRVPRRRTRRSSKTRIVRFRTRPLRAGVGEERGGDRQLVGLRRAAGGDVAGRHRGAVPGAGRIAGRVRPASSSARSRRSSTAATPRSGTRSAVFWRSTSSSTRGSTRHTGEPAGPTPTWATHRTSSTTTARSAPACCGGRR